MLSEVLMETVNLTRRHAEKQQARSAEEKEAEIREEEFGLLPDLPEDGAAGDLVIEEKWYGLMPRVIGSW